MESGRSIKFNQGKHKILHQGREDCNKTGCQKDSGDVGRLGAEQCALVMKTTSSILARITPLIGTLRLTMRIVLVWAP